MGRQHLPQRWMEDFVGRARELLHGHRFESIASNRELQMGEQHVHRDVVCATGSTDEEVWHISKYSCTCPNDLVVLGDVLKGVRFHDPSNTLLQRKQSINSTSSLRGYQSAFVLLLSSNADRSSFDHQTQLGILSGLPTCYDLRPHTQCRLLVDVLRSHCVWRRSRSLALLCVCMPASGVHKQASAMLEVHALACLIWGPVLACLLEYTRLRRLQMLEMSDNVKGGTDLPLVCDLRVDPSACQNHD